jgi:hypothetical protein
VQSHCLRDLESERQRAITYLGGQLASCKGWLSLSLHSRLGSAVKNCVPLTNSQENHGVRLPRSGDHRRNCGTLVEIPTTGMFFGTTRSE